jgi:hypothetical protein
MIAEAAHRLGLAADADEAGLVEPFGLDHAERDIAIKQRVVCEVDAFLCTFADEALHLVTAGGEGGWLNSLLTKEGVRRKLLTRQFKTSPDPSLVRRGTLDERFIGGSPPFDWAQDTRIEGCAALQTKLRTRRQLHAALGARHVEPRAAFEAELGGGRILVLARRTGMSHWLHEWLC